MTTRPPAARSRRPFALLAVMGAAALTATLVAAPGPLSAAPFATTGHWMYNSVLASVFHIDGATTNIDARMALEAEVGSLVLQGDTTGFVVGRSRITEFDKASLTPGASSAPPADEQPLGIEALGGPYVVYRNAGKIVRLGDPAAIITAGSPIGRPVVTDDGTMWLHRNGIGSICTIARTGTDLAGCPVSAPRDHAGELTIVDGRPAFVDLFTSEVHTVDHGFFGQGTPLGVSLSPNSRPATRDLGGKVAILDPVRRSLVLVDPKTQPARPVTVALPAGDYDGPVSTGEVVALVDRQKGTVLTYGADGTRKAEKPIKQKAGQPRLSQGEDKRVYVEDADGTQVLVVAKDGDVHDADVAGRPATPTQAPEPPAGERGGQAAGPPPPPAGPGPGKPERPTSTQPPPVPASAPGAPVSVAAVGADGSATVTWGPAPDNRAPITAYRVSWPGGSTTVGGAARRASITGLANGTRYVFTVAATNRVGTGPGASSGPVTPVAPVSPAAAPVNLRASYNANTRPAHDVTLTWQPPALGGGTLLHYEVAATGQATRQVTATQAVFPQVQATAAVTFTVRAVTRTPDGQTLAGQPASVTHPAAAANPTVTVSEGRAHSGSNCDPPDCAEVVARLVGFTPRTRYRIVLSSDSNPQVAAPEFFTTDANGAATYTELGYDEPGQTIWVTVTGPEGSFTSNEIVWRRP